MAIAWSSNDGSVYMVRGIDNNITICTRDCPLTDEQVDDLYGIVLLMYKTGKTLKELLSANYTTALVENKSKEVGP